MRTLLISKCIRMALFATVVNCDLCATPRTVLVRMRLVLRSRFLQSFRDSGILIESTLIWSASATLCLIKIFFLVFVLSVSFSLAVFGSLCQFRCKCHIVILSCILALSLTSLPGRRTDRSYRQRWRQRHSIRCFFSIFSTHSG